KLGYDWKYGKQLSKYNSSYMGVMEAVEQQRSFSKTEEKWLLNTIHYDLTIHLLNRKVCDNKQEELQNLKIALAERWEQLSSVYKEKIYIENPEIRDKVVKWLKKHITIFNMTAIDREIGASEGTVQKLVTENRKIKYRHIVLIHTLILDMLHLSIYK
ncbi:hypothetical protein, partial [Aquimarina longa]|uniref:hypothetical protein n=1 Tax=Aquimarina longa TaxID=1080221 RepID=UPI000AC6B9D6